jgi:chromosome segregation ATPase
MALMIESIMYLGIGFLAASISVLAVVPIVHTRAVRLTRRQLADTMPSSVAEVAADKDLLRAEFAVSTRTLEMKVEQLKGKDANQLLELGRSNNAVHHLRVENGVLRDRLHATDEQLASESAALKVAEHSLAERASELSQLMLDLEQQSILSDGQKIEIVALQTQVEALKVKLEANSNELQAVYKCRDAEQIEFQASVGALTIAVEKAEGLLSDREIELAKLSDDFNAQMTLSEAQKAKIVTLDGEIEALTRRLDAASSELKAGEDNRNELLAAIKTAELALSEKDSDAAQLVGELSERAAFAYTQANEIFALKGEIDRLTGRLDETSMALRAAEDRGDELTAVVENAERMLSAKELELSGLIGELGERSTLSEAQAREIVGLKAEIESVTSRLGEASIALSVMEESRHALTAAAEQAAQNLSAREWELTRLIGGLNEGSTLNEELTNELLDLKAEVESLTGRLDEASMALSAVEDHRDALTAAAEQAGQALSAKESEAVKLIGELNARSALSEAQADEILSLKLEVETLTGRLDEAGKALNTAGSGHYALTDAAESAERALSAKASELTRLSGQLNERATLGEALANEILDLRGEIRALTRRLDDASNALNAAEDHSHALTAAAENAARALSEKEAEAARLGDELNERSAFADTQGKELAALKAYVDALKERLDAAETELRGAEDRRAAERVELDSAIEEVMEERTKFVSFHDRVAELVGQLLEQGSADKNLAHRARDLENRLAEQSRLLEASESERKQLRAEVEAALRTEAERRSAVIMEIDNQAKAEKAKLQAALDRANGDRTRLTYELATARRQAELLKAAAPRDGIVAA